MATLDLSINEDKFYEQVYKDYGKTKEYVYECVEILRKWSQEQYHLPEIPDFNGLRFTVVTSKFSLERAKEKIDMYYSIRALMPEIYSKHPLSPELLHHTKVLYFVLLPKPTSDHHRVIYAQVNPNYGYEEFNQELFLSQWVHLIEVILKEDKCYNFQTVFDFKGVKVGHLSKIGPMVIKKLGVCLEKVYANRLSALYFVNSYPFLEGVINSVILPFLPIKSSQRLKICENTDILLKVYDKSILPRDVVAGGEERSLEELREMLINKYKEYKDRFDLLQTMKVDESKRPAKLVNDEILGYYGTFRKINVD